MRIRNNNDFVLLLTLILGVLVAFYGRIHLSEYVCLNPELHPYSLEAGIGGLVSITGWTH